MRAARTTPDLDGEEHATQCAFAEALQYRAYEQRTTSISSP
jgi:predicted ATPase with chaperone activity